MSRLAKQFKINLTILTAVIVFAISSPVLASSEKPFIGLQIQGISPLMAKTLGLKSSQGVMVRDVAFPGPASLSDINRGDIILKLAGETAADVGAVVKIASGFNAGSQVDAEILRNGKKLHVKITIGEKPPAWDVTRNSNLTITPLGMTFAALTDKVHERFNLPWNTRGVVVSLVDEKKSKGLDIHVGDVILQVNQTPVWEPEQIADFLHKAQKEKQEMVLLLINAKDGYRFALLPVPQQ
ncbi:MAG: PDZ domain-containing protein [Methylocystaceae bacterium]|nr:PDZ domain-containing protein [Methylocystaceae bacterium]